MNRNDFIQSSTTIRVYEKKLLPRSIFERLIEARDIEEVFKILGETSYADSFNRLETPERYGDALTHELNAVYSKINGMSNDNTIYELATLRYSFHNLKVLIKEYLLNQDFSHMLIDFGTLNVSDIRTLLRTENGMPEEDDFFGQLARKILDDFETNKDPQRIDILLDKEFYRLFIKVAADSGIELFRDFAKDMLNAYNVKALIRSKKQGKSPLFLDEVLIDGGDLSIEMMKSIYPESIPVILEKIGSQSHSPRLTKGLDHFKQNGRLDGVEKELENALMDQLKKSKSITFGPEVLYAYLLAKETEIKNLRIILISKLNGLNPEDIRERLRDSYV